MLIGKTDFQDAVTFAFYEHNLCLYMYKHVNDISRFQCGYLVMQCFR